MFDFRSEEVKEKFLALVRATDGTEPCFDPYWDNRDSPRESVSDIYVEPWTSRGISREAAEELCIDCPVYTLCRDYAMEAKEPWGIWGGTRPVDRGIPKKYRGKGIGMAR